MTQIVKIIIESNVLYFLTESTVVSTDSASKTTADEILAELTRGFYQHGNN